MTRADLPDAFRALYLRARANGYPGTRQEFAVFILATSSFTPQVRAAAKAWTQQHPEPAATTQRRHGRTRADDDGPLLLRVVRTEPADRLLGHLGLDGDES